jgi:hypothetical protein
MEIPGHGNTTHGYEERNYRTPPFGRSRQQTSPTRFAREACVRKQSAGAPGSSRGRTTAEWGQPPSARRSSTTAPVAFTDSRWAHFAANASARLEVRRHLLGAPVMEVESVDGHCGQPRSRAFRHRSAPAKWNREAGSGHCAILGRASQPVPVQQPRQRVAARLRAAAGARTEPEGVGRAPTGVHSTRVLPPTVSRGPVKSGPPAAT